MKPKHFSLAIAALLAAGGLWLAWSAWHANALQQTSTAIDSETTPGPDSEPDSGASLSRASQTRPTPGPNGGPESGQLNPPAQLAPPVPNRRFTDFTPEQRVQFARQGHGPGG